MAYRLGITIGFITNSSSVVHHFPRELFEHKDVKAFMKAFGVDEGIVGDDLWHRGMCATIAVTKEQKEEVLAKLNENDYSHPGINTEDDSIVVIYGDEYESIAATLVHLLKKIAHTEGREIGYGDDYN